MRTLISEKNHGTIDYAVVLFLWTAPSFIDFSDYVSIIYGLGFVHLILTLLTDFKYGVIKIIPFKVHCAIELAVSVILIASSAIRGLKNTTDQFFYIGFGIAVFITWLFTDYDNRKN